MASQCPTSKLFFIFLLVGLVQKINGQHPKNCYLDGYDVEYLIKPAYIRLDLMDPIICPGEQKKESCVVYLSICQSLPNNTSPEGSCNYRFDKHGDVAVCMVVGNDTKDPFGFGAYNTTIDPFHELPVEHGRTSFDATFYHGSGISIGCPTTTTVVTFVCDHSADWTRYYRKNQHDVVYAVESQYLESAIIEGCMLILTMRYDGACKAAPYSGNFGTTSPPKTGKQ